MKNEYILALLRRISTSILILLLMISSLFILIRIAPGSPADKFISPNLSPQIRQIVIQKFELSGGIAEQYFNFLSNILRLDFGISYSHHESVLKVIGRFLPFTILFAFTSLFLQLFFSFLLAVYISIKPLELLNKILSKLSLILYSTPVFVISLILIYIFVIQLGLLPSSGYQSINSSSLSAFDSFLDKLNHLILPLSAFVIYGTPVYFNYLKASISNVKKMPFVEFLISHGYNKKEIYFKHIIPNALGTLVRIAGLSLGQLLSGVLILEILFGLPGMGRLALSAIMEKDYPVVLGVTFISGLLLLVSMFVADVLLILIDKRNTKELLN